MFKNTRNAMNIKHATLYFVDNCKSEKQILALFVILFLYKSSSEHLTRNRYMVKSDIKWEYLSPELNHLNREQTGNDDGM